MEMARVWPIVCQFGVGAILCFVGTYCGLTSGYLDMTHRDDRRIVFIVWGGYLGLLVLSCIFTFWLPYVGGTDG